MRAGNHTNQTVRTLKLFQSFAGSRPGARRAGPILGWTTGGGRGMVGDLKFKNRLSLTEGRMQSQNKTDARQRTRGLVARLYRAQRAISGLPSYG